MTAETAPPRSRSTFSLAFWGAAGLLAAAGLWVSLHFCLGTWKADPDIFVTVELWRGFQHHGMPFLTSWAYTQDNWLLSVIPPASALYEVFGATARNAVLLGWLFFVASVGLTAWLVGKIAGPKAAAATAVVLLFANADAAGAIGFLTYPISHNSSMAWGLLALLLGYLALERRSFALAGAAALAVLVDTVSDPWAGAGVAAPLILAGGVVGLLHLRARAGACALALAAGSAIALWIAHRHPHGLFGFLLPDSFQRGSLASARQNLDLALRALGAMFNIVPGAHAETAAAPRALALLALAALLGASTLRVLLRFRGLSPERQLAAGAAVVSLGAIGVLYLAGQPNADLHVGRFFPNLYFLTPILVALAAAETWPRWPLALRGAVAAYGLLFMVAGVASAPALWAHPAPPSEPEAAVELGQFLRGKGLSYGYGQFWGARALTMETLTHGAVTIRPVSFLTGRISRRRQETSAFWYRPEAEPRQGPRFLYIVPDGEECAAVAACEAIAQQQFGPPDSRIPYGEGVVLVWNHPLAPLIDPMPR